MSSKLRLAKLALLALAAATVAAGGRPSTPRATRAALCGCVIHGAARTAPAAPYAFVARVVGNRWRVDSAATGGSVRFVKVAVQYGWHGDPPDTLEVKVARPLGLYLIRSELNRNVRQSNPRSI